MTDENRVCLHRPLCPNECPCDYYITEDAPKPTYAALVPEYSGVRIVYAVCSNCGQTVQYPTERPYNACPYCSAKIIYKEEKT